MFCMEFPVGDLDKFTFIHHPECLAILVALRLWGSAWKGLCITVFCDNEAVVQVVNSETTRDALLGQLLCNMWLISSTREFELRAKHFPGTENRAADLLSRWHLNPEYYTAQFYAHTPAASIQYHTEKVDAALFQLNDSL